MSGEGWRYWPAVWLLKYAAVKSSILAFILDCIRTKRAGERVWYPGVLKMLSSGIPYTVLMYSVVLASSQGLGSIVCQCVCCTWSGATGAMKLTEASRFLNAAEVHQIRAQP